MDMTSVYAPITKTAPGPDGSLLVYGKVTGSDLDLDEQRCDPRWLATAMPAWLRIGNIREQHDPKRAVGKAFEHEVFDDGSHMIRARVVDPVAKLKVEAGVLTGFSIAVKSPRTTRSPLAKNGMIVGGDVFEVSLVDRPCLPTATLTVCKAATPGWEGVPEDLDEERGLVKCEELMLTEPAATDDADPASRSVTGTPGTELDVEQAKALVSAVAGKSGAEAARVAGEVLYKADTAAAAAADTEAMPPAYDQEAGDVQNAQAAIAIIAKLIVSEASELADNPAEAFDISLLLQSLSALRCFIGREQDQQLGDDNADVPPLLFAAHAPELLKARYTAEQLRDMAGRGQAMRNPKGDPSYPIKDGEDLNAAIRAVGRGNGGHNAIRKHIMARAKALGLSGRIPDNWGADGSLTAAKTAGPQPGESVKVLGVTGVDVVEALTKALNQADHPLRASFEAVVEASTQTTAAALSELGERLVKVEAMATPGGPALRRTRTDQDTARRGELLESAARYRALADTHDPVLRRGYALKAAQAEEQIKALAV
jgi:hypothetical protein